MDTVQIPDDVKKKILELADAYAFRVPYDGSNKFYDDDAYRHFDAGANAGYSLSQDQIGELKKENDSLKEKVNELTMSDMTHEYNQAEAERFRPEYERQLKEPLEQEIERLKNIIYDLRHPF